VTGTQNDSAFRADSTLARALFLAAISVPAQTQGVDAARESGPCSLAGISPAVVALVDDNFDLLLDDGRRVVLAGLEFPAQGGKPNRRNCAPRSIRRRNPRPISTFFRPIPRRRTARLASLPPPRAQLISFGATSCRRRHAHCAECLQYFGNHDYKSASRRSGAKKLKESQRFSLAIGPSSISLPTFA
jgi:hypothetical protein